MGENNHAELKGSIAGQSFSITTKDIISLLLLIMVCLAGWFAWHSNERRLDIMQEHHVRVIDMLLKSEASRDVHTEQIRRWLVIHEFNAARDPQERWPLEIDPALLPPPKPPSP